MSNRILCFSFNEPYWVNSKIVQEPMRKELADRAGQRKRFRAKFTRIGKKKNFLGYSEDTILLSNVVDLETDKIVTDHIWFKYTRGFEDARLSSGMTIEFEARIKEYSKGYVNSQYRIDKRTKDYRLSNPTRIRVVLE